MDDSLKKYRHWLLQDEPFTFDLQLFAAEDEGRTEEPTEKKIREAREKGQVAKTDELPQALVVLAGFFVILLFGSWIYETIAQVTKYYLSSFSDMSVTQRSMGRDFFALMVESAKVLFPIFIAVIIAALAGNLMQVGFQVSSHPLKFDLTKIKFDPATIMKKIFFSKQVGMNLFKSLFKVITISLVSYLIISDSFDMIMKTPDISVALALKTVSIAALKIIIWSTVLLLILSVPDYFFQKREFIESLKMTKQELKEELKETMGDPYIRARLREMQRDIVMRNMISEVPKADVIVTNPTHFAVALKYERNVMEAPTVVAKGADSMALKIREVARQNSIPLIENRPLAQELYRRLNVGDIIPEDLFYAVSLVYAELYRKHNYREAI
ncbi:MAG TPA: flagellar biosynthesis protein FlhB [Spirochaetota bacterium]|nr:flagellar biosynthesis protein FlhB [Spirochaetota bacterium]HPI88581.1 flagellar biosynthesis protein FlhB [Spirochaetota bacterium]HPR48222.1 flagellar biosynthesis protein FlhB [Spirochaetota bacterium]